MDAIAKLKKEFAALQADNDIKNEALANVEQWLTQETLRDYSPYIQHLIETDNAPVVLDSFWRMIPFGTGGRRGPVGAGPNRINPYTITLSVQGHCDYLRQNVGDNRPLSVVVAYDVRQFFDLRGLYVGIDGVLKNITSMDMAKMSAMTYAANGVIPYVVGPLENEGDTPACYDRFISTPELSFLIRELNCVGGLNISASHNHPDDNGGKFYNLDGGQEIPPNDEKLLNIVEKVKEVQTIPYADARAEDRIRFVPRELHERYIAVNKSLCPTQSRAAKVAYSPLSGTGSTTVGEALDALKFDVSLVPEQSAPDGSFKAVRYRIANPEVPDSMDRLREVAVEKGCDVGFATDPDADRLGILVPDGKGDFLPVGGNEIGIILLESILQTKARNGTLTQSPIFINTLVTTNLQRQIAKRYGCQIVGDLMVGFKYMGDVLRHLEHRGKFPPDGAPADRDRIAGTLDDFVFTTEESHGYLLTPRVRDKDACGAAVHLAGIASLLKEKNQTLLDLLRDVYRVYGYTSNRLRSLVMEGIVGLERIGRIQKALRANPPTKIAGLDVIRFVDNHKVGGPLKSSTDEASRNVLLFELENGDLAPIRLVVRPSGTEPKTKIYVEVPTEGAIDGTLLDATDAALEKFSDAELNQVISKTDLRANDISNAFIRYCLGEAVLGDVYPQIPDESLLVSDLVPVDLKISLFKKTLPGLARRITDGASVENVKRWFLQSLKPFGEDPIGLIRNAVDEWLRNQVASRAMSDEVRLTVEALMRE